MAALLDRHETAPRTGYDLPVSGLHTFYAVAGDTPAKANRIRTWLRGSARDLDWQGYFGPRDSSLGKAYYPPGRGDPEVLGNGFYIKLVRAPGHKAGYYVQTCYPK